MVSYALGNMLYDHYFVSLHSHTKRLYFVYPESEGNECEDILKGRCREKMVANEVFTDLCS